MKRQTAFGLFLLVAWLTGATPSGQAGWRDTDTFHLVNLSPIQGDAARQRNCLAELEQGWFPKGRRDGLRIVAVSREDALRRKPDALSMLPSAWTDETFRRVVPDTGTQGAYLITCDPEAKRLDIVVGFTDGIHGGKFSSISHIRLRGQPLDSRRIRWVTGPRSD